MAAGGPSAGGRGGPVPMPAVASRGALRGAVWVAHRPLATHVAMHSLGSIPCGSAMRLLLPRPHPSTADSSTRTCRPPASNAAGRRRAGGMIGAAAAAEATAGEATSRASAASTSLVPSITCGTTNESAAARGAQYPPPLFPPSHPSHLAKFARGRGPQPHGLVPRTGGHRCAVGRKGHAAHPLRVAC